MWDQGYLDAGQMAGAFALLRANDLIWSRLVRQYLLGEREPATTLAGLERRRHAHAGRGCTASTCARLFLENRLSRGRYAIDGRPVALTDIRVPIFAVGTERDHVAPWESVYKIRLLTDTEVTFVLAERRPQRRDRERARAPGPALPDQDHGRRRPLPAARGLGGRGAGPRGLLVAGLGRLARGRERAARSAAAPGSARARPAAVGAGARDLRPRALTGGGFEVGRCGPARKARDCARPAGRPRPARRQPQEALAMTYQTILVELVTAGRHGGPPARGRRPRPALRGDAGRHARRPLAGRAGGAVRLGGRLCRARPDRRAGEGQRRGEDARAGGVPAPLRRRRDERLAGGRGRSRPAGRRGGAHGGPRGRRPRAGRRSPASPRRC